jgi:hypothetical protein
MSPKPTAHAFRLGFVCSRLVAPEIFLYFLGRVFGKTNTIKKRLNKLEKKPATLGQ